MSYFAAIDIGSNAMRLAIAHKTTGNFHISYKSREPVRLGSTVFDSGFIEESIYHDLKEAMLKFSNHMTNHNVQKFRAVATSAMREAKNNREVIDKLHRDTGIRLEIISGEEEARLVAVAIEQKIDMSQGRFLIIDIGGGSIELILIDNGKQIKKESFVLGTVRLLQLDKTDHAKEKIEDWLPNHFKSVLSDYFNGLDPIPQCVGTGGNMDRFNKLKSFVSKEPGESLKIDEMKQLFKSLDEVDYKERILKFCLTPDRADVIIPAAIATVAIMEMAGAENIHLPLVGLKDGLLHELCTSDTN